MWNSRVANTRRVPRRGHALGISGQPRLFLARELDGSEALRLGRLAHSLDSALLGLEAREGVAHPPFCIVLHVAVELLQQPLELRPRLGHRQLAAGRHLARQRLGIERLPRVGPDLAEQLLAQAVLLALALPSTSL